MFVFSSDTPLLVRSSSDSALGPQLTETEPSVNEGNTVMVRPLGSSIKRTVCYKVPALRQHHGYMYPQVPITQLDFSSQLIHRFKAIIVFRLIFN